VDALIAYLHASLEFGRGHQEAVLTMFQMWAMAKTADPRKVLARASRPVLPFRARLIAMIEAGQKSGTVHECNPGAIVDLLVTVCDGLGVQRIARGVDSTDVIQQFQRDVLEPLRASTPTKTKSMRRGRRPARSTA
jgi:hypothetical protein